MGWGHSWATENNFDLGAVGPQRLNSYVCGFLFHTCVHFVALRTCFSLKLKLQLVFVFAYVLVPAYSAGGVVVGYAVLNLLN